MLRNVASQKWRVYAWDTTTGLAKTGDAANISAYITKDDGTPAATNDVAPAEASSTNEPGYYDFDLTQAETSAAKISLSPKSATSNIQVIACPPVVYTVPQYHSLAGWQSDGDLGEVNTLTGHTAQTGDSYARLGAPAGASVSADIAANAAAIDAVDNFVDTEIAAIISTLGTPTDLGGGATLAANNADMAGATFATSTDSQEAIRNAITALNDPTAAAIADAICDEALSGHTTAGTLAKAISDILVDTNELQTNQGDWATATGFSTLDASGIRTAVGLASANLDTQLTAIDNYIDTEIAAIIAAIGTPSDLGSGATLAGNLVDIEAQTDDIGAAGAGLTALATAAELAKVPKSDGSASWNATALAAIQAEAVDALQEVIPDTVPSVGSRPNMQQAVRMCLQGLTDFDYTGDKFTIHKEDGSTTLIQMTLDDATNATLANRTT